MLPRNKFVVIDSIERVLQMDLKQVFGEITTETNQKIEIVEKALKDSPPGKLRTEKHSKKNYLVQDYYVRQKRCKHCLTKDSKMLKALIRKEINEQELASLKSIKELMELCRDRIIYFDTSTAVAEMKSKYPQLTEGVILDALKVAPTDEWAAAGYERSTFKQEELKQITTRGLKVRSKSEAMIAEKLYQYNLPFRYEEVLHFKDFSLVPDFIIRRADGKLFYWEHQGLTNDKTYIERQFKKSRLYASVDIVPWNNLIITYDNESGLDLRTVEFEIQNKLLI